MATTGDFDLVILDRMLPIVDGLTIVRTLRASGNKVPILILSALGEIDHRVDGLKAGADDYLVKPFAFSEMEARVDALCRRTSPDGPETLLCLGDLEMNLITRAVTRGGSPVDLQPREFRLLEYLMRHADQVITRTMLLEHVWDYHFDPQTNVIDVHVSRLRGKIDKGVTLTHFYIRFVERVTACPKSRINWPLFLKKDSRVRQDYYLSTHYFLYSCVWHLLECSRTIFLLVNHRSSCKRNGSDC